MDVMALWRSVKKASEHLTKITSDSEHALKKTEEGYKRPCPTKMKGKRIPGNGDTSEALRQAGRSMAHSKVTVAPVK